MICHRHRHNNSGVYITATPHLLQLLVLIFNQKFLHTNIPNSAMTTNGLPIRVLPTIDPSAGPTHLFSTPSKKIHESNDVSSFLTSQAYVDIMTFLLQLNRSMFPLKSPDTSIQAWELNCEAVEFSAPVRQLQQLLAKLEEMLEKAPPDQGPRRFGNVAFRRWFQIVEGRADELLEGCLAPEVLEQGKGGSGDGVTAKEELKAYFLGSWGSAQRLDYGTGHELSFLAFLGGIWKLNGFPRTAPGVEERAIVLGVVQPYAMPEHIDFELWTDNSGISSSSGPLSNDTP